MLTEDSTVNKVLPPRSFAVSLGQGNMGRVRRKDWDWADLVKMVSTPRVAAITHDAYWALPKKSDRDALKEQDPFVVLGQFSTARRHSTTLVSRSGLALDVDSNAAGTLEQLRWDLVPVPFAYAWHTTRSHRAEDPRLRIYIPLARDVDRVEFKKLTHIALKLFDLSTDKFDRSTDEEVRLMFMPVRNAGGPYEHGVFPGDGFMNPDHYMANAAPVEAAQGVTVKQRAPATQQGREIDPLELKQPDPRWTLDRVKTELVPWLRWLMIHTPEMFDRSTWLTKLLGGLHHQFRGSDEGRELAHDISSRDSRTCVDKATGETAPMYDSDTLDREWSTLRADRREGNAVTVGTLIKLAEDARAQAPVEDVIRWLARLPVERYEQIRKAEAERINVRVGPLDDAVKKARRTAGNADGDDSDSEDEDSSGIFERVEPWPEHVDGAALLDELTATFRRFIVCSDATARSAALWAVMTWVMDSVSVAPIAAVVAPTKRSGKTQMLTVLGRLCRRALAASNISPAALFRAIEAWKPTLLLDEADAFIHENEELRGILNAGHTRDTAYVVRTVGEDHTPTRFNVFGAKAIAGIGHLADTLMDRSIVLELRRKLPTERVDKLRDADPELFAMLRSKLARWSHDNAGTVSAAQPGVPDELHDRAADNWFSLLQIAETAGGTWPDTARRAALMLSGDFNESQSAGVELLGDIQVVFEKLEVPRISMADLLTELLRDDDAPWRTWSRGRPMSTRQLGKLLGEFGIRSKPVRIGHSAPKGFDISQFDDAFARYTPAPPTTPFPAVTRSQPNTGAGSSVTEGFLAEGEEMSSDTLEPLSDKACDRVTAGKGVTGDEGTKEEATFLD